jgi:hypothetical protein
MFCGPWWVRFAGEHQAGPTAMFKGPIDERMALCGDSFVYALASPVRVFFQGEEGNRCAYDGSLNPFLLIFGIFGLTFAWHGRDKTFLAVSCMLFLALASLLFSITARYLLPVAPALIFLTAGFLSSGKGKYRYAAIAAGAFLLLWNAVGYASAAKRFNGWGYLTGRETKDGFLRKNVGGYDAMMFMNDRLKKDSVVYFVFLGNQVYHVKARYFYDAYWDGTTFTRLFTSSADGRGIFEGLASKKITHILYRKDIMGRFLTQNNMREKFSAFKELYTRRLYEDGYTELLELAEKPK